MTELEVKKAILNKLMFAPNLTYGELHKATENHDLFNYHLRELVTKGFILKSGSTYALSTTGRQQVALMEEDGQYQKQFKVSMFMNLFRKVDGKWQIFLHRRKKHPHYDYVGAITGKLKWGESLESNMRRELQEELQITPTNFDIMGVHREIFHNEQGEAVGDGVFFIIYITEWEGIPLEKNIEGEYFWLNIDEVLKLDKIFKKAFETWMPTMISYLENPKSTGQRVVDDGEDKLEF